MVSPIQTNKSYGKSGLSLQERLVQKSISHMEKHVGETTDKMIEQGTDPNTILQKLIQGMQPVQQTQDILSSAQSLANTPVTIDKGPSNMTGLIPALFQSAQGGGFTPFAQRPSQLGMNDALQILNMQQQQQQNRLAIPKDLASLMQSSESIAKGPLERRKLQTEIEQMDPKFKQQELTDEENIKSKFDLEKEQRSEMRDFKKTSIIEPALAGESAKQYGLLKNALPAINTIEKILNTNPNDLRSLNVPGNPKGQQIASMMNLINNNILRQESGAVISPQEKKDFANFLSPQRGLKAITESPEDAKLRVQNLKRRITETLGKIDPNYQIRESWQQAKKAGYSDEEIYSHLKSIGKA